MTVPPFGQPKSIAVLVTDHLGDLTLFSGAWAHLRRRFPHAKITAVGRADVLTFTKGSPDVDRMVEFRHLLLGPFKHTRFKGHDALARLTRPIWSRKPQLEVDLLTCPAPSVSKRRAQLLGLIKYKRSVGYTGFVPKTRDYYKRARIWERGITDPIALGADDRWKPEQEIIIRWLQFMGCELNGPADLKAGLWLNGEDRKQAERVRETFGGKPYGMIVPGASVNARFKTWPADRYGKAIALLGDDGPPVWLVDGSPAEKEMCAQVAQEAKRHAPGKEIINLCSSPLRQMAALMEAAEVVYATNNGGMHLATALGVPAIGLSDGCTKNRFYPWGDPAIHKSALFETPCWGCEYFCTEPSVICMEGITPERVAALSREAIGAYKERKR